MSDNGDARPGGGVERIDTETVEMWSDSAMKRLDHVHDTLETIAAHSSDQATIDATKSARETIVKAQRDIREIEGELADAE